MDKERPRWRKKTEETGIWALAVVFGLVVSLCSALLPSLGYSWGNLGAVEVRSVREAVKQHIQYNQYAKDAKYWIFEV
jgi:hypothetical protein